jgi:hypothetical protein
MKGPSSSVPCHDLKVCHQNVSHEGVTLPILMLYAKAVANLQRGTVKKGIRDYV